MSALWQGTTYFGPSSNPSAPANDINGYQVKARATSPSGANLNYYFEWSNDTAVVQVVRLDRLWRMGRRYSLRELRSRYVLYPRMGGHSGPE